MLQWGRVVGLEMASGSGGRNSLGTAAAASEKTWEEARATQKSGAS